jgi:hypothetical protein
MLVNYGTWRTCLVHVVGGGENGGHRGAGGTTSCCSAAARSHFRASAAAFSCCHMREVAATDLAARKGGVGRGHTISGR